MIIRPIFTTYLAEDVPAGPQGQPSHKKGSALSFASQLNTTEFGNFIMTTPNPVFLFLDFAEKTIARIQELSPEINSSKKMVKDLGKDVDTFGTKKVFGMHYNCANTSLYGP